MPDLTFVGDSLISGWTSNGRAVLRSCFPRARILGYPGLRPEVIAERLLAGDLERVRGTAVVMAGVHSMAVGADPLAIAEGVLELADIVARHADRVILCSILPAWVDGRNETPRIFAVNQVIRRHPAYLDMHFDFRRYNGPEPLYVLDDGCQLSALGYLLWARLLASSVGARPPRTRTSLQVWARNPAQAVRMLEPGRVTVRRWERAGQIGARSPSATPGVRKRLSGVMPSSS